MGLATDYRTDYSGLQRITETSTNVRLSAPALVARTAMRDGSSAVAAVAGGIVTAVGRNCGWKEWPFCHRRLSLASLGAVEGNRHYVSATVSSRQAAHSSLHCLTVLAVPIHHGMIDSRRTKNCNP